MKSEQRVRYEEDLDFWINFDPAALARECDRSDDLKEKLSDLQWKKLIDRNR